MKNIKLFALLVLLFPLTTFAVTVYKSTDANGNVVFSETPAADSQSIVIQDPQSISLPKQPAPQSNNTLDHHISRVQELQQKLNQARLNVNQAQLTYGATNKKYQDLLAQNDAAATQATQPHFEIEKGKIVPTPNQGDYISGITQRLLAAETEKQSASVKLQAAQQTLDQLKKELVNVLQNQ